LTKSKAVSHVEEDIDVAIYTPEELLARPHCKDGNISQGVDALCLVSDRLMSAYTSMNLGG